MSTFDPAQPMQELRRRMARIDPPPPRLALGCARYMTDLSNAYEKNLIEAHEAADVSAINGIVSLVNILRKRHLLNDAETSAIYESISLPLGLPKYAENPIIQEIQLNLDRLFAEVIRPK